MTDENRTPDTPTSGTDDAEAAERAIRLSKPEETETATANEPTPSHSALETSDPAPSVAQPGAIDPIPEHEKGPENPTPSHSELETSAPAPSLSDPLNRDKEATGEGATVRAEKPAKSAKSSKSKSSKKSPTVSPSASLEDGLPVIPHVAPGESTTAPESNSDQVTINPMSTPSASEIVTNAKKKAAEIVEDRVNMSGSVRQAKNARYEAIQETKEANAAFEKAADEVGSVTDKLEGSLGVMDFLLDKELNDLMDAPPAERSRTSPSAASAPNTSSTSPATSTPNSSSTSQEPEWKRKASELHEQKRQQEQEMLERRRAQTQATLEQRSASDDQLKAGRAALEARLREERAASEARMKSEREAIEVKRRAEQERLRAERAAMDARLKEEREAREAERRASKKLGRDD